jgi:hypothetical protein
MWNPVSRQKGNLWYFTNSQYGLWAYTSLEVSCRWVGVFLLGEIPVEDITFHTVQPL